MIRSRRILAILAHPDDESLAMGGVLARYATEGVETFVVCATRGEAGRYFSEEARRPEPGMVGRVRELELRNAAAVLGVRGVAFLGYLDGRLDRADPDEAVARIVSHIRRIRPDIVLTFDPYGAYGHPDHVAVCQFTTAAVVAAADPSYPAGEAAGEAHRVAKLYYLAWDDDTWDAYQHAFRRLVSRVDGDERVATPWPRWAVTTRVDTRAHWQTVWRAVQCHRTQLAIYGKLGELPPGHHEALWGSQSFYRAFSLVNGGRERESDLLAGLR